jgi:hypothetical protein
VIDEPAIEEFDKILPFTSRDAAGLAVFIPTHHIVHPF